MGLPVSREWWDAGCPQAWSNDAIFGQGGGSLDADGEHASLVQPVMRAICMGGINGVAVGQEIHRNLLLWNHAYEPPEEILYGSAPPRGTTWAGAYIDDLGTVQVLSKNERDRGVSLTDDEIMKVADEVYGEEDLLEKKEKEQRRLPGGKLWGCELPPEDPTAGAPTAKLQKIICRSLATLLRGCISRQELEQELGLWFLPLQPSQHVLRSKIRF